MRVLIAPVGEQPTPNLIPLFAATPGECAQCVQFLVSNDERIQRTAENLRQAIARDPGLIGISVPEALSMNPWDLAGAREDCEAAIAEYSGAEITVNLTGGTKIMSLAAYQAAVAAGVPMVYVNTARDELARFDGSGRPLPPVSFTVAIPLETQLRAAGRELKRDAQSPLLTADNVRQDRAEFVTWLVDNYRGAYEAGLMKLVNQGRRAVKAAGGKAWPLDTALDYVPAGRGLEALRRLHSLRLLAWDEGRNSVRIPDGAAWEFLDGGWVETYALVSLHRSHLFDRVLGKLKLEGLEGEIDALVTHNGRLGLVECKSKGPHGEGATFAAAKIRQYQLDFGGTYARGVFALAASDRIVPRDIEKISTMFELRAPVFGEELRRLPQAVLSMLSP